MKYETLIQRNDAAARTQRYSGPYEATRHREELQTLLARWRQNEDLTSAQVALRMGIKESTLTRIEKNIDQASFNTLARYALACGINHSEFKF